MKENTPSTELSYNDLPDMVDIVGISFRTAGKIYYFAANGIECREGEHAIVETTRGAEYGIVTLANHPIPKKDLVLPLRSIVRVATPEDDQRFEQNAKREEEAYAVAVKKIAEHELAMKLVDVEYTFDNSKLLFYFTSDDRVDFRELVKDLASVFRTRIELRQIGIRDEAKMMGGLGICGREFCCHSFLGDFAQVTIKMAKEQNLSLNAAKISGACGKLMCCLRYEYEAYQQEAALTPKVDSHVTTPDGPGVVVSSDPMRGICNVRLDKSTDQTATPYHRDLLNRPENPTTVPVTIPEKTEKPEKAEKPARPESPLRGERPARRTPPAVAPAAERTSVEDVKEKQEATQQTSVDSSENAERNVRKGNHHGSNKGRNENRKKSEHKDEVHGTAEPKRPEKNGGNNAENKQSSPAPKADKEKHERKDHSPKKHPRPQPSEKKADSKFDVKFAGGDLPAESKTEERHEPRHNNHGRHHHRGGKKNEKKPQKTENNN